MKPRVKEVVVVEGRYDRNTLLQAVDATVVEVGGFALFNDREKAAYLRRLAEARGVILLTDPDGAGFVIRNHLKGCLPPERVKQAYIPDVYGKEKRKRKGGKEGKLFGAITSKEISEGLASQFQLDVPKQKIVLDEPIKAFGTYEVKAKLGYEVSARFSVSVSEE